MGGLFRGGNEIIASLYSVSFINNIDSFSWGQKNKIEKNQIKLKSRKIVQKQKKSKHQLDFL